MDLLNGIDVKCPACGRRSRYPRVHAGKTAACPSCKHEHIVPDQDGTGIYQVISDTPTPLAPPVPPAPIPPAPIPSAPSAAAKKAKTMPMSGEAEKILFVCASCQYRARIPAQYAGMAVRCPSCNEAQIANADNAVGATGKTVQLSKLPSATHKTTIRAGNVLFICSQCNFEAQLAKHYVGKAIRCPGCHAPQVVAGESTSTDPAALERNAGAPATPAGDPRFICVGCGYRARIPTQYMGLAVTCPKCDTVQIATPEDQESSPTGDTVAITKMKTASADAQLANPQVAITNEPAIKMPEKAAADKKADNPAPKPAPAPAPGDKIRFTCSACSFKARIPASYAGENIHCPSCNAVQLVLRSGQLSPNATGNTQIIQIVQTAQAAASPDAIATPTNTPSRGVPTIADPEKERASAPKSPSPVAPSSAPIAQPAPAKPAPAAKNSGPILPPPALTVAQPAGTAAAAQAEVSIDDLLNSDNPLADDPAGKASDGPSKPGKVVRRGSDRLTAVKAKTPAPEVVSATKPAASKSAPLAAAKPAPVLDQSDDDSANSEAEQPSVERNSSANNKSASNKKASPAVRPAHHDEPPAAKNNNGLMVIIIVFMVVLLAALGGLGYVMLQGQQQIADLNGKMSKMSDDLGEARKSLDDTNKKLNAAQEEAKLAKEAAELAQKKSEEEAAARKKAEEDAAALAAKLKEAEEKAAADKAAAEKAAAEKAASEAASPAATETTPKAE
jgi:flagellar basal body-associated protein FliL/DNA-directed RNA polymerase subunit RPC12/RpoP